jgi:hypothetical protein
MAGHWRLDRARNEGNAGAAVCGGAPAPPAAFKKKQKPQYQNDSNTAKMCIAPVLKCVWLRHGFWQVLEEVAGMGFVTTFKGWGHRKQWLELMSWLDGDGPFEL